MHTLARVGRILSFDCFFYLVFSFFIGVLSYVLQNSFVFVLLCATFVNVLHQL